MNFQGKIILITGVGPGLGKACAEAFAQAEAKLVICDVNDQNLADAKNAVEQHGAECLAIQCDVSSSSQVSHMFEQLIQRYGTLDVLVNNAALTPTTDLDTQRRTILYDYNALPEPRRSLSFTSSITDAEWEKYWGVNVNGVFYCMREALKLMEAQGSGHIVNIASIAGLSSKSAHSPAYSATKGAVIALTKSVAYEVAGANIFVNALAPGGVATPQFNQYLETVGEEACNRLWQSVPLGRFGTLEEYASTVLYLSGEHYLVGQVISPNGGIVI
ncbi:SDR family NAD(P)-dependent oxidoreductase [Acinetobacter silvestris]|uniref:Short-chain dehydrogenase n=1 Tax=Acinetobacter silvestris TaxID=1977882 RepID=A0A1Y3CLG4_9GAMM|nr:SDR family NAD(P)-dependent oxidoreductase [Acinetobacter silvestris]OTG65955.1 short-chain dehydrogenase [Acinetobacter silvestris]